MDGDGPGHRSHEPGSDEEFAEARRRAALERSARKANFWHRRLRSVSLVAFLATLGGGRRAETIVEAHELAAPGRPGAPDEGGGELEGVRGPEQRVAGQEPLGLGPQRVGGLDLAPALAQTEQGDAGLGLPQGADGPLGGLPGQGRDALGVGGPPDDLQVVADVEV